MKAFFLKIRKTTGWALIALSILLMLLSFLVLMPSFGDIFGITRNVAIAGGIYVASQPPWYLGLFLLGPEIIVKTKELYNMTIQKIWRRE